jgi:hypothetical protein
MPTSQIKAYLGDIPLFTESDNVVAPEVYSRPADWLELPVLVSGTDHKVVGLFAVGNHLSNFVAFQFSGAYTVDWGDGTAPENFSAAAIAYHNYVYSNLSADTEFQLAGTGEIHRQAIISITPQSGQNLTSLNFNLKHNQSGLSAYRTPFLDISVCAPSCTSLIFSGTSTTGGNLDLLEKVSLIQTGTIVTGSGMFAGCASLQSVPLFNLSAMTNGTSMFQNCSSLKSVPLFDLSAMTNGTSMFAGCASLQSVPLFNLSAMTNGTGMFQNCSSLKSVPLFDLSAMTNGTSMFAGCASLQSVPLFDLSALITGTGVFQNCSSLKSVPLFNLSAMTNGTNMFIGCASLQSVPLFNLSAMTIGTSMFNGCRGLKSVPLFNLSAMTNGTSMFQNCSSLQSVPLFNLSALITGTGMFRDMNILQSIPTFNLSAMTTATSMFANDVSLQSVPALNLSAMTSSATMFVGCSSLAQCKATGIAQTISFANCKMSATELNELYTNLSTVTGKTLTVSGNYGYSTSDTSIATAKGWTVN